VVNPEPCTNLTHPALGVIPLTLLGRELPLEESSLPAWYTALEEDAQEAIFHSWIQELASWVDKNHGLEIVADLAPFDFSTAISIGYSRTGKYEFRAAWSPTRLLDSGRLNPEHLVIVNEERRVLVALFGTWDGVTSEQQPSGPYWIDQ
jgi:hypothetical protein